MYRGIFGVFLLQCYIAIAKGSDCKNTPEVICYWGSWSIYRTGLGQFDVHNIHPELCTTIVYTFIGLNANLEITSLDSWADVQTGGFKNLTDLKKKNPCLKTTLAIGGWNEGSKKYSVVASSDDRRKKFADSVLNMLTYYGFDGLDLDWEYPGARGGLTEDKQHFVELLKEVKNKLSPWNFKLSVAVPFQAELLNNGYDLLAVSKIVDGIDVMAYDNVSPSSTITGLSAPMSLIEKTVSNLISLGVSSEKIILGIPAYGRCFALSDKKKHDIGSPVAGPGEPGYFTKEAGFLAYHEVLDALDAGKKKVTSDGTKYAYDDNEWITYDDTETVRDKVKYAVKNKLGGIMLWSIDLDDFRGRYHTKFPLLSAINEVLNRK